MHLAEVGALQCAPARASLETVMALVPHVSASPEDTNDITHNLPSLQFESSLTDEERDFLSLRARSHAITVSQCAHAAYFVSVCNRARKLTGAKRTAEKKASKRIQEGAPRYDLKIGILGCGRLGSHLAVSLLSYGNVDPTDLEVSTRRPETLEYLQSKGVVCYYDNQRLAERSDLLFFCVLPSQLPPVLEELKSLVLRQTCLIYSFVLSVTAQKLKYMLSFSNILKPEVDWDHNNADRNWDYTSHISTVLEQRDVVEKTSPLSFNKKDCVVKTSEKFAEMMIFGLVNMLSALGVNKWDVLTTVNMVVFGDSSETPLQNPLVEANLVKQPTDSVHYFPNFDLTRLTQGHTPVLRKLVSDVSLRRAFQMVYCQVFQDYVHAQKYSLVKKVT